MIIQNIYLQGGDWQVTIFYAVDDYYLGNIINTLEEIGCKELEEVENMLIEEPYNVGLTYSNVEDRCSVIVIGLTTSTAEFQNTFDHEKGHLAMHIAETDNIDVFGEEFQYLTGMIGQLMFPVAKKFLCEHCRKFLKARV